MKELIINKVIINVEMVKKQEIKTSNQGVEFLTFTGAYSIFVGGERMKGKLKFSAKDGQVKFINRIPEGGNVYIEGYFNQNGLITVTHFQELE